MEGARRVGVFFFSSRRRHTRLQGDWSSDVCSSDLSNQLRGTPHTPVSSIARSSPFSRAAEPSSSGTPGSAPSMKSENRPRSEEHTSELQSPCNLVCRLLLEKKKSS